MEYGTYMITGVTGFLGSLLTKTLLTSLEYYNGKIRIVGICRDKMNAEQVYHNYDCQYLYFIESDILDYKKCLAELKEINQKPDYIFHCAANTTSSYMISNPVETADGIIIGTKNILEIAYFCQVKSMVYLSSIEVYGKCSYSGKKRKENELGNVEIFSSRGCYPLGKRIAEHYCYIYYREYQVPVKIARLAQIFGTGVLPSENRIFIQFARAVYEKKDIILHTDGKSIGNYCESMDAVNALFILLSKGKNGEAYNVVNEEITMSICDMAELVVNQVANGQIHIVYKIPDDNIYGYAEPTELYLSAEKIKELGWRPVKNMLEMYQEMLQEINI